MNGQDDQFTGTGGDEDTVVPSDEHIEKDVTIEAEKKCEEYRSGWQRAVADYQNLQKEMSRQRSEWVSQSELTILEEFLPVYSNFKKAFASKPTSTEVIASKDVDGWIKGIGFIMKQFGDILKAHGIDEMKTVGEMFDPTRHDSVGEEDVEGVASHTIVREVDSGYTMKGKIVHVAKVIVAK